MTLFSRKLTARSIFGLLLFVIGIAAIVYDFDAKTRHRALISFFSSATSVKAVDDLATLEGKLVYAVGKPTGAKPIVDPDLGLKFDALYLRREVEIYQWVAYGSKKRKYRTQWVSRPVDSTKFKRPDGHTNRGSLEFSNYEARAEGVLINGIPVDTSYLSDPKAKIVSVTEDMRSQLRPNIRDRYALQNGRLVEGGPVAVGRSDPERVGANRVSYFAISPSRGLALGFMREGRIVPANVEEYGNVGEFVVGWKDLSPKISRMERDFAGDRAMRLGFSIGMFLLAVIFIIRDFKTARKIVPPIKFGR
jgi:Protein of unknown function (DUF1625).